MGINKTDRFGNPQVAVPLYFKGGNAWAKGYVEIGGKLYQLECNPTARGEGKQGDERIWVTVTRKNRRSQQQQGGGRGQRGGL